MTSRVSSAIIALFLFIGIGFIVSHTTDLSLLIERYINSDWAVQNKFITTESEKYVFGKTTPILLGKIENNKKAYLHLTLRFRFDDTKGYPNVFQTAQNNSGLRLEISDSSSAFIVPDLDAPNKLRGIELTGLKKGTWYAIDVEALNGSFIRILLDGKPVYSLNSTAFFIDLSQIIVGRGFNSDRIFRGDIDDIHLVTGTLHIPNRGIAVTYSCLAVLILLFVVAFWFALAQKSDVRQFFIKVVALGTPLLLILVYCEFRLSDLNTNYYLKRAGLEQQIEKTELLVLGSSNAVYGINTEAFTPLAFNLAFLGNEMYVDEQLVYKYEPRMPKLKMAIFVINYFTMGTDYTKFTQTWRQYFVKQFFDVNGILQSGAEGGLKYWLEPGNFSKIALYGNSTANYVRQGHASPIDIITNSSGWLNTGNLHASEEMAEKLGPEAANAHNASFDPQIFEKNMKHLTRVINYLQNKHIKSAIIIVPTDRRYHDRLSANFTQMCNRVKLLSDEHSIIFKNYTDDPRFSLQDFTPTMIDHLNAKGATKLTHILDQEIISSQVH